MFRSALDLFLRREAHPGSAAQLPAAAAAPAATILVVDDDDMIRDTLVVVLGRQGWRVLAAQDGAEALWVLERRPVDLVIADLTMPVMDGHELTRRMRAKWPTLPVLLMTGDPAEVARLAPAVRGATGVLAKPFSAAELVERIRGLLKPQPGPVPRVSARAG